MNLNSIRKPRRMTLALSGMVAAATLVAGAGSASANFTLPNPTSAICDGVTQCKVHDGDGIAHVARKDSGTGQIQNTGYGGQKNITVFSEGKYDTFTVTDKLGFKRTFTLITPK